MFIREFAVVAISGAATLAWLYPGAAQNRSEDLVPREAAALPERLSETGERAPEPVPSSSASDAGEIDLQALMLHIGRPATQEEVAAVDIDVMPDGVGAPEGSGTFEEGEDLYALHCASCHGEDLQGISELGAPRLIGGRGTLDTDSSVKTVESYWPHASTLFDYTHRAMPLNSPGSLAPDEVYAITAYILGRAGILDENTEMNAGTFGEIEMPNVDGFVSDPRPDTPVGMTGGSQ